MVGWLKVIGILATSHPGHRAFLHTALESLEPVAYQYPYVLGWDAPTFDYHHDLPKWVRLLVSGKKLGLQAGERRQIRNGTLALIEVGCTHVLKIAGDQMLDAPQSIPALMGEMGAHDFLSIQAQPAHATIGTQMFFAKAQPIVDCLDLWDGHKEMQSTIERFMFSAATHLGYKRRFIPRPEWERLIGHYDLQRHWGMAKKEKFGKLWASGAERRDITRAEIVAFEGKK
jgi:hypothetical protein